MNSFEKEHVRYSKIVVLSGLLRKRDISGKAWLKLILSKLYRKHARGMARSALCGSVSEMAIDPFFLLLLSGDVELNPGPINTGTGSMKENSEEDRLGKVMEVLVRLESGQASIMENQSKMLVRLADIENELEKVKGDVEVVKGKHEVLESKVVVMEDKIKKNNNHGFDMKFLLDRHEQYSRKNSIRVQDVKEEDGENIEQLTIETIKGEIGIEIEAKDIDIVHRVGRRQNERLRAILVKFMLHKTKESIMRKKKEAKHVKIREDLAPGIKQIFDEISINRRSLNVESVWTIDGRIKFRFTGYSPL